MSGRFHKATSIALALLLICGVGGNALGATSSNEVTEREVRNAEASMNIAAQGMVLLENKDDALPVAPGVVALFGAGAIATVKGGTGSGDVNQRYTVNVYEGLKNAGYTITSEGWITEYQTWYDEELAAAGGGGFAMFGPSVPLLDKEISDEQLSQAKASDTAIYVIARNSGEGADRKPEKGDWLIDDLETANIKKLAAEFDKLIVVLNVGGVIDTSFSREIDGIDAVLLMSQAGMRGGDALALVLSGEVTPSGKLVDTWAKDYQDYPSSAAFSGNDGNTVYEEYTDGIYVGYRYFDTFGVDPAYPFGFGLSYADFTIAAESVEADAETITVKAAVTNTSDTYSGKEVAQVYFSAPQGSLEKPYQELAAYGKTDELKPGESQTLTLTFPTSEMSSYDEDRSAYVLEAGDYILRVGNSSRSTQAAAVIRLDAEAVTEQLSALVKPDKEIETLSNAGAAPFTYDGEADQIAAAPVVSVAAAGIKTANNASLYIEENVTAYVSDTTQTEYLAQNLPYKLGSGTVDEYHESVVKFKGDYSQYTLKDVYDGLITMEQFVSGLDEIILADIVIGGAKLPSDPAAGGGFGFGNTTSPNSASVNDTTMIGAQANSVAGAAGETVGIYIESKKIPNIVLADGPAGLRVTQQVPQEDGSTLYQFGTAWPIGTLLAQTWDTALMELMGSGIGEEMVELGVTLWLAPGMNIHRNPLCGRNFEYFSEDPLVTGLTAAAETKGAQSRPGVGVTLKHYAGNSQEDNRNAVNNTIPERAFREIYLKGFEIAVKSAQPMAIMTSYNQNQGIPAADSYDLCVNLTRGEWGFQGLIMTDWGGGQSTPGASMHAGNDLIMPGSSVDTITINAFQDVEPIIAEDGIFPVVTAEVLSFGPGMSFPMTSVSWGEFIPSPDGDVVIETKADNAALETATRPAIDNATMTVIDRPVKDLIAELGEAAIVTDNGDGTSAITYKGSYVRNNISLGDLQKSVINILNVVIRSSQFANMFEDVEAAAYTPALADTLVAYVSVEKD
ncbi:MAG: glycoside hydrolase family 3 C-terminal domain-containing protein [Oscillospiraceae bacterium]|jgi:beta-glucosidase|nr:glycoside hydrolase family 3 C-terminal domain-containing protein [Oscillospiraceae bacterium]